MADQTDTTDTSTTQTTTDTSTSGGGNDAGGTASTAAVDTPGSADDTTALGSAGADTGAGDTKSDSQAPPSPTPVPDDAGVPEAYELKSFKVGEGESASEVKIDASLLETVTPGLKEAGVTQAQLDKLAPMVPAIQEASLKQMNDEFAATRADWAKQAKADPEIGGNNWAETIQLAGKALDQFGAKSEIVDGKETNEFRKLLNESGLGEHPVMIRMFRNIGAAASEDSTFTRNTTAVETPKSREERMYPNDQPKTS